MTRANSATNLDGGGLGAVIAALKASKAASEEAPTSAAATAPTDVELREGCHALAGTAFWRKSSVPSLGASSEGGGGGKGPRWMAAAREAASAADEDAMGNEPVALSHVPAAADIEAR